MTRDLVRQRAGDCCENCRLHEEHSGLRHHIEERDEGVPRGPGSAPPLALACHRCNLHKGTKLTGIDPQTGQVTPLFHPRRDHALMQLMRAPSKVESSDHCLELRTEVLKRCEFT